jgi:hypothetical protein
MTKSAYTPLIALTLLMAVGCNKPTTPEPVAEGPASEQPAIEAETPEAETATEQTTASPDMAVSKADIEKAAELFQVLHDDGIEESEKKNQIEYLLDKNDWDEEAYLVKLYDITQDPVSRAYYIDLIAP